MRIVSLFFLFAFLVPVLFVMGTVASEAEVLGPFSVGPYQDGLVKIAQAGRALRTATETILMKEIDILRLIADGCKINGISKMAEELHHAKLLAERSI